MYRKLTRKEKLKIRNESPTVIEQGNFVYRSSYLLLIFTFICGILLIRNFKLPQEGVNTIYIIVLILTILFFGFMCILLPIHLITTTKTIIIENKKIRIESNRHKYSINTNFDKLVWWRRINTEYGGGLQLKFDSKKISLTDLEFPGLFEFEKLLRHKYAQKEKTRK